MRILLLSDGLNPSGAERQFALLGQALKQRGLSVKVHSLNDGFYAQRLRESGIDVVVAERRFSYDVGPFSSIAKTIKSFSPQIVHSWGWMSTVSAYMYCKAFKIPLVAALRTATNTGYFSTRKLSLMISDYVISNSQAGLNAFSVSSGKGTVIYNGFCFDRVPLKSLSASHSEVRVVMTATMRPDKDWFSYADAIRLLRKRPEFNNVSFLGIGGRRNRDQVLEYCKDLLDNGSLALPGFLPEPLLEVSKCDIGVLATVPYVQEGTSNAILEYMACSLPVVCSKSGGNIETVVDGETGILVEPGNPVELADAIGKLCVDRKLAAEMGSRGRARLEKHYAIDRMVQQTFDVYNALVNP